MRALLVGLFLLLVILAPLGAPADPLRTDPAHQLEPPGGDHLLGTDLLGRDVLSRALYGGQHTLLIAALATVIAALPGVLLGLAAALRSMDRWLTLLINALLAFPGLLLALLILTLLGQGALPLALATGITQIAPCARVTRAAVIGVRSSGYVEAARSLGGTRSAPDRRTHSAQHPHDHPRLRRCDFRLRHPQQCRAELSRLGRRAGRP